MRELAITFGIGLVSGVLSGAFGIGGGIVTTPAIRLILGAPALIAVGTPLPVIFPSALTGALNYARNGVADVRAGITCGIAGVATAVLGAWTTQLVGGTVVLLATAALILWTAADMILQVARPMRESSEAEEHPTPASTTSVDGDSAARSERAKPVNGVPQNRPAVARLAVIGLLTGFYSGFLGLGGGFVLVPLLTRWVGFPIKRAIATSLVAVTILAVPGTITHALLGNIDWRIAAALAVGVVPGAFLGSRFT
ncbi:MAG: sulfite exporter TauE/SafE family protein, partial [Coriobacteriia bacterium]|nr:sulfite exporter TauE/SafE family protein [Coriobacteriia bacterium]